MLRAPVMTARRRRRGRARETGPFSALSGAWLQERRDATSSEETSRTQSVVARQLGASGRVETSKKTRWRNSKTLGRQNRLEEDADERSGHEESGDGTR